MAIKKIIMLKNTLIATALLAITACSTVRDTTDWLPGVDSNEEIKAEHQKKVQAIIAKERQAYKDKTAFASTARSASESDARISVNISQKFTQADGINREDIGIEVNAGVVTLTGNINSNDSAVKAIAIAKNTAGVSRVISRLVVVNVRISEELPAATQTGTSPLSE